MTLVSQHIILQSPASNDPLLDLNTQPSLDLQFATGKTLNDRVSGLPLVNHQRDASSGKSAGTYVGSDGLIKTSPVNLFPYSENFSASTNWGLYASRASITNGYQAPFGGLAASKYTPTVSNGYSRIGGVMPSSTSNVKTFSVYVKANGINFVTLRLDTVSGPTARTFNLLTGEDTVGVFDNNSLSPNTPASSAVYVKDGWWRISITGTFTQPPNPFIYACADATTSSTAWNGTDSFYIFGAQLEEGSTATDYIPTTTVASGAPRFDHDPVTGESLGLLIEEERTNLAKYSEPDDRSNPGVSGEWSFVDLNPNTEITKVEGPDGVSNSASEMQLATGNSVDTYLFHAPVTPGASYTFSAWVKLGTATNFALHVNDTLANDSIPDGTYSFDVNDGLNTNTFVKVSHTFTAPSNGKVNVHIGRHGGTAPVQQTQGTVTVWGCQLELGAFSSSTIITTGSTVTRAADIVSIEGTNFSSWYNPTAGSFYVQESSRNNALDKYYIFISNGANNDRLWLSKDSVNRHVFRVFDSTNTLQVVSASDILPTSSGLFSSKFVGSYLSGDSNSVLNGILSGASVNNALIRSGSNSAYLGRSGGGDYLNGHISRLAYYPYRLSDTILQEITS